MYLTVLARDDVNNFPGLRRNTFYVELRRNAGLFRSESQRAVTYVTHRERRSKRVIFFPKEPRRAEFFFKTEFCQKAKRRAVQDPCGQKIS